MKLIKPAISFILIVATVLITSCMKHSCYECVDQQDIKVAEGCDKTRNEVKNLETNNNWECMILPD